MKLRSPVTLLCATLLVGCSALQIDVDVYKGPLVNEDSMQRDQMLAMAMSAKLLMLSMRNKLLDDHACGWDRADTDLRRKTLPFETVVMLEGKPAKTDKECAFRAAAPSDEDANVATPPASPEMRSRLLRNARQLNSILSFYDDRDDLGTKPVVEAIKRGRRELDDRRLAFEALAGGRRGLRFDGPCQDPTCKAYREMRLAAGHLYTDLVRLLRLAEGDGFKAISSRARNDFKQWIAASVSDLTDPEQLQKAAACFEPGGGNPVGELMGGVDKVSAAALNPSTPWRGADYDAAREALRATFLAQPQASAEALLRANQARRAPVPPERCRTLMREPREEGIVRKLFANERRLGSEAEDNELALEATLDRLVGLGESGFDNGRIEEGLDSLANLYAAARDRSVRAAKGSDSLQLSEKRFARLDHLLVDMAARMQFLATNLWLIDDTDKYGAFAGEIRRFKALLESIATNIIVHADDLRRQRAHSDEQSRGGGIDRPAANMVFAVDAGATFTRIERRIGELKLKAVADEASSGGAGTLATLQKEKLRLEGVLTEETNAATTRRAEALDATALLNTVVPGPKPSPLLLGTSPDTAKQWGADRERVRVALTKVAGNATVDALRIELDTWLTQELAGLSSAAFKDDPRAVRLRSAKSMLDRMVPLSKTELKRTAAFAELKRLITAKYQKASELTLAERTRDRLQKELDSVKVNVDIEQRRIDRITTSGTFVPSARYDAVSKVVSDARAEVLGMAATSKSNPDGNLIMGFLRLGIERAMDKQPADQRADHRNALSVLQQVGNPAAPVALQQTHEQAVEVLDSVIGQLRFLHIDALRTKGRNSEEAKDIEAALAAARRQREDHIYLRPASAYLRSVYAATYTQPNPRTEWRNMLVEQFRNLTRKDAKADPIKEELDKTYWQTINTVRLAASGSSNFVVAKDDVGNWYVKAMGSDPAAMIKAAKQLALYNLGSQLDSNLLRVDELRNTIDARRANGDAPDEGLQSELNSLTGGQSGAAVTARSQTLKLFKQNYDELSIIQLKDLQARLAAKEFTTAITKRWATTLEKASDPKALDAAFENSEVKLRLQEAETAAIQGVATANAPGTAMVTVLQAMSRTRGALKAVVQTTVAFTSAEAATVASATLAVAAAQAALDARNTEVDAAAEQIKLKEAERTTAIDKGDDTAKAKAETALDEARRTYASRVEAARLASKDSTDKRKLLVDASAALAAAKTRQEEAVRDVDAVLKTAIDEVVAKRLRVVDETETAVKVIGRSGSS